ncbi:uncharacterized protein LOC135374263 [Ornithodoros turicata]|uniref:uncharacterized protein LOC135374263 n=1 Tax=Ornithodoros turicata TaxID=34597 RepID=UPI0031386DBA
MEDELVTDGGPVAVDARRRFHVVEFRDKSTYVISSSWVSHTVAGTYAHWPEGVSKLKINKLIRTHEGPKDTWTLHHIRILHTTDDADEAFDLLPAAEDTSNLEHDEEYRKKTRKTRKRVIIYSDEDDDEEEKQPARKKKKGSRHHTQIAPPPSLPPHLCSSLLNTEVSHVHTSTGNGTRAQQQHQRPSENSARPVFSGMNLCSSASQEHSGSVPCIPGVLSAFESIVPSPQCVPTLPLCEQHELSQARSRNPSHTAGILSAFENMSSSPCESSGDQHPSLSLQTQ